MANEVKLEMVCPDVFGFSTRRYRQLANEGVLPKPINGSVNFIEATRAVLIYKDRQLVRKHIEKSVYSDSFL